jgi:hypothetical protein
MPAVLIRQTAEKLREAVLALGTDEGIIVTRGPVNRGFDGSELNVKLVPFVGLSEYLEEASANKGSS